MLDPVWCLGAAWTGRRHFQGWGVGAISAAARPVLPWGLSRVLGVTGCLAMYSVFWQLPEIIGIDNPMLEDERVLWRMNGSRSSCVCQKEFGLDSNPDTNPRLFVSLGRLVRQKGVDILADVAEWLLDTYEDAQLLVIGQPADGFGYYAKTRLEKLARFKGRLVAKCEFVQATPTLKWGADFCLMPSRDEPFGYVDIEFAWHGAVIVGAQSGEVFLGGHFSVHNPYFLRGLGKVPGFYYVQQNRENLDRLRRELRTAVTRAMEADERTLKNMSRRAMNSTFPLAEWQACGEIAMVMAILRFMAIFRSVVCSFETLKHQKERHK
eukprot:Skav233351  [mRNA]  locus=scaffold394:420434:426319:- [translate_table: standard]